MDDQTSAAEVLRRILTDLADLTDDHVPYQHVIDQLSGEAPVLKEAADLAVQVAGVSLLPDEDPKDLDRARLEAWARHAPAAGIDLLASLINAKEREQHDAMIQLIGEFAAIELDEDPARTEFRQRRCREVLRPHRNWADPLCRDNVVVELALARSGESIDLQPFRESEEEPHRLRAMAILAHTGSREDWPFFIEQLCSQSIWSREEVTRHVETLLTRVGAGEDVFDLLERGYGELPDFSLYLEELARVLARFGPISPRRYQRFVHRLAHDKGWVLRELSAHMVGRYWPEDPVPLLERLMQETDTDVQQAALKGLTGVDNDAVHSLALKHLHNSRWRVREWAVNLLGRSHDPGLLDHLFPLTRDPDSDVREAALQAVVSYEDERILPELLASCLDPDESVRKTAERILQGESQVCAACLAHPSYRPETEWYADSIERARELMAWGEELGSRLTGKPVKVKAFRQGLGQTPANPRALQILIQVNVTPLLAGEKRGESIVRGLILHEIGHHLFDIGVRGQRTTWGIAQSEGLSQIYAILMDERLERKMRTLDQSWGRHFDRLNAYAYNRDASLVPVARLAELLQRDESAVRDDVRQGLLPGKLGRTTAGAAGGFVSLFPYEMAAYPGLQQPTMVFLVFLLCRMDLDRCPLPEVAEAVQRVPANLKDLDHAGVLEVCRELASLLGRDEQNQSARRRMLRWIRPAIGELEGLRRALERMEELGRTIEGTTPQVAYDNVPIRVPRRRLPSRNRGLGSNRWNRHDEENLDFDEMDREETLAFDQARHQTLIKPIRRHIRHLQPYLEQLGRRSRTEEGHRTGQRPALGNLAGSILRNSPRLFLREVPVVRSDCYIGILIDRSGSMEGENLKRACSFAALVAESASGIPGILGHVNAFDDEIFVRLGDFRRHTIASLESMGGNNDSGALNRAAQLAQASGSRNRLLIMISDGCPTDCSVESLQHLVEQLTNRMGIVCAQVAVDTLPVEAFPHSVNLTGYEFHEAVALFGRLLVQLTRGWR